ncbi:DeoR family transcriptional regulator [Amycolatopsis thermoflava]
MEEIATSGRVVPSEMAARLGGSEVTIRGDPDELERRGRVKRTRGGAVAPETHASIVSFDARMSLNRDAKRRIAQSAAASPEIRPGGHLRHRFDRALPGPAHAGPCHEPAGPHLDSASPSTC